MTDTHTDATGAQPLGPLKRLPPLSTSSQTLSSKRARLTVNAPLTPHPSSDADAQGHNDFDASFPNICSIPLRISAGPMTPSTSTVAFSSSPRRAMMSSSPSRSAQYHPYAGKTKATSRGKAKKGDLEHDIVLEKGTTVVFGRHRHNQMTSSSTTTLESTIPKNLSHLVAHPTNDATVVHLSRHASHASRVHAAVELVEVNVIRVIVIGQNGLRLRVAGQKKGVRLLQGQRYDLALMDEAAELDFFGCRAMVRTREKDSTRVVMEEEQEQEQERRERLFSSSPMSPIPAQRLELASSLPPSSPPMMMGMDLDDELSEPEEDSQIDVQHEDQDQDQDQDITASIDAGSSHSRDSSPLSPPSEAHLDLGPSLSSPRGDNSPLPVEPTAISEKTIKAEQLETVLTGQTDASTHGHGHGHTRSISRACSPARPVPSDVDLPAIIASTVVFSGSSKLSLPDLVKHMLEAQPSLKEYGDEPRWTVWVEEQVESNPMFGKVERHGKDSSGHPLLPHYFYNPASDPDTSRAKELGGLVRPLRSVQRGGGKAIDWRPVGRGRRS
ncbi:hypothetical protein IAR55_005605 [Kwoniella newhampshirensis]|uniref:FHA domain-containing protein n=1 Tax=Kwoniella newhampshirensis TaxID=1651941 RepID=A0AAW0YGV8_9TREE